MATKTSIEWTESTWNPITGCNKISPGCKNCYAERMAKRLKTMGSPNYADGFKLSLHEHVLELPLTWKKPQIIFVNSMSDLFHKNVPFEFIQKVFDVMNKTPWHTYQVLTKRSDRLKELNKKLIWTKNIWMGVSIENQDYTYRIDDLKNTNAYIKFLSIEPLIGPVRKLKLDKIKWVIVGGESGPKARPMKEEWVLDISERFRLLVGKDQCIEAEVPFFFPQRDGKPKQWGGKNKKKTGRLLDRRTWDKLLI